MSQYYHLFPFGRVMRGARVILYGAGEVGCWYAAQLQQTQYATLVAVADQNWDKFVQPGYPLIAPERIPEFVFDVVIISIENASTVKAVKNFLMRDIHIPEEKIITCDNHASEAPSSRKSKGKRLPLSWGRDVFPLAVFFEGGLGDCLIYKRQIDEIMAWDDRLVLDCYVRPNMEGFARSFFAGAYGGRLHDIIPQGPAAYEANKDRYDLAFAFSLDMNIDVIRAERLQRAPQLLAMCRKIEEQCEAYGHIDWLHYPLHYLRCEKDGLDCYTACNRYAGFHVTDFHTDVPMQASYARAFDELALPTHYLTMNYGFYQNGKEANCKAWPLERFERLAALLKARFPHLAIVQVGSAGFPEIAGCDRRVMGQSLELVKYVLRGSLLHIDIEGGLVHLAAQLGTRSVVLFGPTPIQYYAYADNINIQAGTCHNCIWYHGNNWQCYRKLEHPACMYAITPEQVFETIVDWMGAEWRTEGADS